MPIKRKGKEISQMIGQITSATKASGQHKTKRIAQASNAIKTFICFSSWRVRIRWFQAYTWVTISQALRRASQIMIKAAIPAKAGSRNAAALNAVTRIWPHISSWTSNVEIAIPHR